MRRYPMIPSCLGPRLKPLQHNVAGRHVGAPSGATKVQVSLVPVASKAAPRTIWKLWKNSGFLVQKKGWRIMNRHNLPFMRAARVQP